MSGPAGIPLQGFAVQAYSSQLGNPLASAVTNVSGQYSILGLPSGNYFLQTRPPFPNPQHYTGMTYANIPSNDLCGARGTEVAVGTGTTAAIDFSVSVGASIQGDVTRSGTGEASVDSAVAAYDLRGCDMGSVAPEANGAFEFPGLPPGKYYLATRSSTRADQLYPGLPCTNLSCDIFSGTPVATGAVVNFVLSAGSSIAGTVLGPGAAPLPGAQVEVWKATDKVTSLFSPDGHFSVMGLSPGIGYRILAKKVGFVTEVYPNAPCPAGGCNVGSAGTGIDLPAPGTAIAGVDIQLAPGHSIQGSLSPGSAAVVQVFGSTGLAGEVSASVSYNVPDLPDGNYVVRATMGNALTELYNNHPCAANQVCLGDTVTVSGADRTGINFSLGGAIPLHGMVHNTAGDPIGAVPIEILAADGTVMSAAASVVDGSWTTSSEGLPSGTYYVRTRLPRRIHQYADRLWNGRPCGATCIPTTGTPVVVPVPQNAPTIDIVLPFSGLDFFALKPCRVFDSRSGPTIASGVLVALRLEGACGIPGDAYAVSANVTVTSASVGGVLALWPENLPFEPVTTTLSFNAGVTRANNSVLEMSLEGLQNIEARATLPGGRYHLILDVNGYFARDTPP
ncbi:MAG: carboxypeptidase-like regulatory domain-containing protein [Acidobacteriota bacterium]